MRFIGRMVLALAQLVAVLVLYQGIAMGMALVFSRIESSYDAYNALGDTEAMFIILLVWDRFFGPTASLFRAVGKALIKAQRNYER